MNTRTKKLSTLRAALGGAGLARTGAMLALVLGAAQAGATTYTVPLKFNITLTAPACSFTVGSATVDATTAGGVHATGHVVNLTASASPSAITTADSLVTSITDGMSPLTVSGPGVHFHDSSAANVQKQFAVNGTVNCTLGTPMTARIAKVSALTNANPNLGFMVGAPASGQQAPATFLPVGMSLGFADFAGTTGGTGNSYTTWNSQQPTLSATATGFLQTLRIAGGIYARNNATILSSNYAGTWTYTYNVALDF